MEETEKKKESKGLNFKTIAFMVLTFIIGLLGGKLFFSEAELSGSEEKVLEAEKEWTCSMHPQIRQGKGSCPICGMDLIPAVSGSDDEEEMEIKMSESAIKLAEIQTMKVKEQGASRRIHLNGKVKVDERMINRQTAHLKGRVDKLLFNYTGEQIKKGDIIGYVYSPELVTAQKELLEAKKTKENYPELFEAARKKLENWKVTSSLIDKIVLSGEVIESFPLVSDFNGVIVSEIVKQGDYVNKGEELFEIVDLSQLWILFDAYEKDIAWMKEGDQIEYEIHSLPGEKFIAEVSFIDPIINMKTRVAEVRVTIKNKEGRLKPEMFVSGKISSNLEGNKKHLVVPKSAVLWTGKRSIVYVKTQSDRGLTFKMQEVVLGPDLGEDYVVEEGLNIGEEIAVSGAFSIDAAAQLAGKPSMMNPPPSKEETKELIDLFKTSDKTTKSSEQLENLLSEYIDLCEFLAADDLLKSEEKILKLFKLLKELDYSEFENSENAKDLERVVNGLARKKGINEIRSELSSLTEALAAMMQGKSFNQEVYLQYCPMANNNKGANWFSLKPEISNPYFGASMLHCGETQLSINSNQ